MKKLIILMCILSLLSCSTWDVIVGTDYWNDECIEILAVYDSSNLIPKKWYQGQTTIVYMTDLTDSAGCTIIWGRECMFKSGEMLYVKSKRSHAPGSGTSYWKYFLINKEETIRYSMK